MGALVTSVRLLTKGFAKHKEFIFGYWHKCHNSRFNIRQKLHVYKNFPDEAAQVLPELLQEIKEVKEGLAVLKDSVKKIDDLAGIAQRWLDDLREAGANSALIEEAEQMLSNINGYGSRLKSWLEEMGGHMSKIDQELKAAGVTVGVAVYLTGNEANAAEINEEAQLPAAPTILDYILADESSVNERFQAMMEYNQYHVPKLASDVDNVEINVSLRNKVWETAAGGRVPTLSQAEEPVVSFTMAKG